MISRTTDECVPNIGPEEQKKRTTIGTVTMGIGAALAVYLVAAGAQRPWRLLVLLPFWAGAIGLFQVKEKTCVALSSRGLRNMDAGDEPIADPHELDQVRAQARKVHIEAFVTAVLLTL